MTKYEHAIMAYIEQDVQIIGVIISALECNQIEIAKAGLTQIKWAKEDQLQRIKKDEEINEHIN